MKNKENIKVGKSILNKYKKLINNAIRDKNNEKILQLSSELEYLINYETKNIKDKHYNIPLISMCFGFLGVFCLNFVFPFLAWFFYIMQMFFFCYNILQERFSNFLVKQEDNEINKFKSFNSLKGLMCRDMYQNSLKRKSAFRNERFIFRMYGGFTIISTIIFAFDLINKFI